MNTCLSVYRETWGPTKHQHLGPTLGDADVIVGGVSLSVADEYLGNGEGGLQGTGLMQAFFCAFAPLILRYICGRASVLKSSELGIHFAPYTVKAFVMGPKENKV